MPRAGPVGRLCFMPPNARGVQRRPVDAFVNDENATRAEQDPWHRTQKAKKPSDGPTAGPSDRRLAARLI